LGFLECFLLHRVALRQCLRLRLVLLLECLYVGARSRLFRGPFVIGCLLLLQFLPLSFLAVAQVILGLLIHPVALNISGT
jgi:hypothetical protein